MKFIEIRRRILISFFYNLFLVIIFLLPSLLFAAKTKLSASSQKTIPKAPATMIASEKGDLIGTNATTRSEQRHSLYLVPTFFISQGKVATILPMGLSGYFQYEWSFIQKPFSWIPSLFTEVGFIYMSKNNINENAIPVTMGPEWVFRPFAIKKHTFFFAPTGGAVYMHASSKRYSASGFVGAAQLIAGYRYLWEHWSLGLVLRYSYFFDGDLPYSLQGMGISLVTGYSF